MGGFTPPTKIKKVISSDSDCKNSPIRMRLFRNRIVDYSLHVPNTAKKKFFKVPTVKNKKNKKQKQTL